MGNERDVGAGGMTEMKGMRKMRRMKEARRVEGEMELGVVHLGYGLYKKI